MATRVYTTQLLVAQGISTHVSYANVGADLQVIRDIAAVITPDFAGAYDVVLRGVAGQKWISRSATFPSGSTSDIEIHWEGRQVVLPGQSVEWFVNVGTLDVAMCGYDLTLP